MNLNDLASKVADLTDTPIDEVKEIQACTFDVVFARCNDVEAKELLRRGVQHAAERAKQRAEQERLLIEAKAALFQ